MEVERLERFQSGDLPAEDGAVFSADPGCYLPFPLQAGMTLDRLIARQKPHRTVAASMCRFQSLAGSGCSSFHFEIHNRRCLPVFVHADTLICYACGKAGEVDPDTIGKMADATKALAGTAAKAIEATTSFGRVIKDPIQDLLGIVQDRVKFARWERQPLHAGQGDTWHRVGHRGPDCAKCGGTEGFTELGSGRNRPCTPGRSLTEPLRPAA
jgi:hypothetical protein